MANYYADNLAAERLRACYEIAPPRVKAYLEAEIEFVLGHTDADTRILELGCGYGRVLQQLLPEAGSVVGIDISFSSLRLTRESLGPVESLYLTQMDAARLGFPNRTFDLTICIQNGISAMGVRQEQLFAEAVRVTRRGGTVLFSSYLDRFWPDRLQWFEMQSAAGLIGVIDYQKTGNGIIACTDGFYASMVRAEDFRKLASNLSLTPRIHEVDCSSLFCEVTP